MAAISAVSPTPNRFPNSSFLSSSSSSSSPLLRFPAPLRRTSGFGCSAAPPEQEGAGASPLLKFAVSGATELLRILSPKKPREDLRTGDAPLARSVDDVVQSLRSDYERAYFLTGNLTSDLYAEDCLFEDPTIKFRGKDRYSQNLDLLVPFFDCPSLKLEQIEKACNSEMKFILAKWKLRTYLKFPWKPLISISGTTIYDLDEEFKIVRHAESWNISALEAVGQIFSVRNKQGD